MTATLFFAVLTMFILIGGLVVMAIGGKLNKKYSNKLMVMRVVFQALAIIAIATIYYFGK